MERQLLRNTDVELTDSNVVDYLLDVAHDHTAGVAYCPHDQLQLQHQPPQPDCCSRSGDDRGAPCKPQQVWLAGYHPRPVWLYRPSLSGCHHRPVWLIPSIPVWLSSPFCLAIPSTFPAIILILPGLFSSCCRSSSLPLFSLLQFMGAKALIMNVCVCVCVCVCDEVRVSRGLSV